MKILGAMIATILVLASQVYAQSFPGTTRYVSTTGNDANSCSASADINTPKLTFVSAIACMNPGDTLYIRGGLYTERINLQDPGKTGTSSAWIKVAGYPGESVEIRYTDTIVAGYGGIKARGNIAYVVFENFFLNGVNATAESRWQIRDGNHHFIIRNMEIANYPGSLIIDGSDVHIINSRIHDTASATRTFYGIYVSGGANVLIDGNDVYHNNGGGIHAFPGPISNLVVRNNRVHHNNYAASGSVPGILVYEDIDYKSGTAIIDGVDVYNNVVFENGVDKPSGTSGGIRVANGAANVRVLNNTVYGNNGYGISVHADTNGPPVNTIVQNNITTNNIGEEYSNTGTNTTVSHNACTSAESCGSTGKVTLTSPTDCFVDAANDDYRLKSGTNPCRNAGTSVSTRPAPVGVTDIGAYEQGLIASAIVTGGFIEATVNVSHPGVLPTSGINAFSLTCGTCSGTPVLTVASKPGASNVVLITVSGIATPGTGTLNYNGVTGNMTDSGYIGSTSGEGTAQGINTVSGLTISGTINNSAGGTPPTGSLHIHHTMNEGSGTTLADEVGSNDSTLSGSPTWSTTGVEGGALYFPNDGVDRRVTFVYGNTINPTSQSFTFCLWAKMDAGVTNKVVMGPPIGTNQRMYIGTHSTAGTWGIGVGSSTISSVAASEFPVVAAWTRVCLINNATTDVATLAVNGVKGTSAASVKSSASVTDLAGDFLIGCGIIGSANCGGYTIDEPKIWTLALSDAELLEDFESYTPPGTSVGGYAEVNHRCQRVYLTGANGSPINIGTVGQSECTMQDGGAIALEVLLKCTGGDCGPVAVRPYATDNLGNTSAVPQSLGSLGLWMWGDSTDAHLNKGVSTCCMSGSFVAVNGITVLDAVASNTIDLADGEATQVRWIFRCGQGSQNKTYTIEIKQDNSATLSGAAGTTPTLRCVAPTATGGF